jgi:hypothetical protein
MRISSAIFGAAFVAAGFAVADQSANAALVVYSAFDDGQASPIGSNSAAEQALFLAAVGPVNEITFETPVPSDVTISGGSIINYTSGFQLYGGNTTPGGSYYLSLSGGSATFGFTTPVSVFGAYFSGLQVTGDSINFSDGTSQSISIPVDFYNGGMAFVGFTDIGASITSVTINAQGPSYGDIIGVDDVFYNGTSAIPEASTWAMMVAGFAGLGFTGYRKAKSGRAAAA